MILQFYIGAIVLCSILVFVYFILYTNMILNIRKNLESSQKGQSECLKDPMEIETVRYQMKYLYKNENIQKTLIGFGITVIVLACLIILLGIYIQYVKGYNNISIFPGFIILLFAVSVVATFKRENFTNNTVLAEYETKYTSMKDKLQRIIASPDEPTPRYPDVSSLPETILTELIKRFGDYNDLHQVVSMPLYSKYETLDILKKQLSNPEDNSINVEELMKYLKFNKDSNRTVRGRDADGNMTDIPVYLTDIDILRPRDTRTPFVNDLYGTNTYNPYESLKKSLKPHIATILVWTIVLCYLLFHMIYRNYGESGNFTTIFTFLMILVVIIILIIITISPFY